eukprot:TRINITY_DN32539_c0_g1_i1.p1 TRINITY_DN32539_c0_g1~~TRINITY_DN32539_c0_g1_i1.p1  ORF type:complete len:567 (-),score=206.30 TRINITY_DN32539_c0_g1_i1:170-1870(-)
MSAMMPGALPGGMQPQIILLREGTDASQGKSQIVSNINACAVIGDIIKTTLGPRGMDKLIHDKEGRVTITNDGATVLKLLNVDHPAARTLVDIAKSQDNVVGDGTTSVALLACELLKVCKPFVEDGLHPQNIISAVRAAGNMSVARVKELSVSMEKENKQEERDLLIKCAKTTLNSKLIKSHSTMFSNMVVDAIYHLKDEGLNLDNVAIKKVVGGGLQDSQYVEGIAFKKTFSYAGFEQQPKKFENPRVILLNIELEHKSLRDNSEIEIKDVADYQKIVDAEWSLIYDILEKIVASGAKVVLSKLPIGDLATQYFADRGIFCAGRVPADDMKRLELAIGTRTLTTVSDVNPESLGKCAIFEERMVGGERFNFFQGCPEARAVTIILRGGAQQFIDESERSLHDALMIVRRAIKNATVVGGGGAIEMEIHRTLLAHSRTIAGRDQLLFRAYAKAMEIVPRQLCENAGFDSTDILSKLRSVHRDDVNWQGVDIENGDICDTFAKFIWEPALVKVNALTAATEAACLILSIDETIRNPRSEAAQMGANGMAQGGAALPSEQGQVHPGRR